ncbi:hypothetical protein ZWY2020_006225 [Hordeum vulgare]|nr:hypothetical protein ZWY2020_006225 [Hordeum vulgare]
MKEQPQIVATLLVAYLTLAMGVKVNSHQTCEEEYFREIIKQHVKRTVSTKFGEVFDCVDIDQQPTLHHALLKNHSLQMKPSSYPKGFHLKSSSSANTTKSHLPTVACPIGTVPILQRTNEVGHMPMWRNSIAAGGEIAGIKTEGDIYGARVTLNIYEPQVKGHGDFSSQVLTLMHGEDGPLEAIAVGSMVSRLFGENFARFHIIWLGNNKKSCMDFYCQGFVQTVPHIGVGARISPVSTYNGKQVDLQLMLFQDPKKKHWWLFYETKPIGYWPNLYFTKLRVKANIVEFGGYVNGPTVHQDPPQMGSGHFAAEGNGKAAYARDVKIVDSSYKIVDWNFDKSFAYSTKPTCYTIDSFDHNSDGAHVYYGGPGGCHPSA